MELSITPWQRPEARPDEESVKQLVRASGKAAMRWSGEADKPYRPHRHTLDKTLWCAAGAIDFTVDNDRLVQLRPGDMMELPAGTLHAAVAGPEGVVCYEAPPVHENVTVFETDR